MIKFKRILKSDAVMTLLLEGTGGGPFDGGCLTLAKAIIRAADGGSLVRITSNSTKGLTEHYGARVNGKIIDGSGVYYTPEAWMKTFKKLEAAAIRGRQLSFAVGYDEESDIPDDPHTEKQIAAILGNTVMYL